LQEKVENIEQITGTSCKSNMNRQYTGQMK